MKIHLKSKINVWVYLYLFKKIESVIHSFGENFGENCQTNWILYLFFSKQGETLKPAAHIFNSYCSLHNIDFILKYHLAIYVIGRGQIRFKPVITSHKHHIPNRSRFSRFSEVKWKSSSLNAHPATIRPANLTSTEPKSVQQIIDRTVPLIL